MTVLTWRRSEQAFKLLTMAVRLISGLLAVDSWLIGSEFFRAPDYFVIDFQQPIGVGALCLFDF